MFAAVFNALIYDPLYNGLVFLVDVVPRHDVGVAVVFLTVVVRIALFPLARRTVAAQLSMKRLAPEVEALKKKHKGDAAKANAEIMALYRDRGVHPLAGFGLVLVQMPILIALYYIFARSGLPSVDAGLLYPFVHAPEAVNMLFLGLVDMGVSHNVVLALLVALSQMAYTRLSMGRTNHDSPVEASLSGSMAKSFDFQARYVLPLTIGVIAYVLPAAAPLYYLTSNLFMIVQEYAAGRRF